MKTAARRRLLFDRFSTNLALYHSDFRDTFLCPLCHETFRRNALEGRAPTVSLAHIIPGALGGKTCTLTCTECNNRFGTELEGRLASYLSHCARMAGHDRIPSVRLKGPFGNVGVELKLSPDEDGAYSIFVIEKQSNKQDVANLKTFIEEWTRRPFKVDLNFSFRAEVKSERIRLALCHSAFLLMFHYFGYEYVLKPNVQSLRRQLFSPDEEIHKTQVLVPGDLRDTVWSQNSRWGVMFLDDTPAILAFLRVRVSTGPALTFAIVLPALEDVPQPEIPIGASFRGDVFPCLPDAVLKERWPAHRAWWKRKADRASSENKESQWN